MYKFKNKRPNGFTLMELLTSEAGHARTNIKSGFTLMELLIVMVVIAGLASIFITSFPASQKRARDTNRRNDIKQYQTAMELYNNKNGVYIIKTAATKPSTMCATLGLTNCPNDPKDGTTTCSTGTCAYNYVTNGAGTEYSLWSRLEQPQVTTSPFFITCSSGRTYEGATAPSSANPCP